jgi:predicted O-methyltransferase YrrM
MIFLRKIQFLLSSKAQLSVVIIFIISKISNIFIKKIIIQKKRKHQSFLKNKKITNDYFSSHSYNFHHYLQKLRPEFNYLEIGAYEGNSAIFIANDFNLSKIHCVDNWTSTEEYINHINFSKVEKNFDYNIRGYKNIKKIKASSDLFFKKNKETFDVIYVDGHHLGSQVFKDCNNAWKSLVINGYLICDDYIWKFYQNLNENPCYAINKFLKGIKGSYKVEKVSNSQIFIKKVNAKS